MEDIGKRIKLARELAGLTQQDIEKRAHISQALLSGIERGQVLPTVLKWLRIVEVIGLPLEYFIPERHKGVLTGKKPTNQ